MVTSVMSPCADHAHVRRQRRSSLRCLRMVDLEAGDVDVDRPAGWRRPGRRTSIVWVTMLTVPPRFMPGDWSAFMHVDRNVHADGRAFAEAQEVHMDRNVLDGVELEVARDHAMLGAVDVEIVEGGEEVARVDALAQFLVVERDHRSGALLSP